MPETVVQQPQHQQPDCHIDDDNNDNNNNDDNDDIEPPAEFVCPISLEVMNDPVMSKNGQNYDRDAILEWLNAGNVNCPLTRQPLKPSLLVPNASLRILIMRWKMEHGITYDYVNNRESSKNINGFIGYVDPKPMTLKSIYRQNAAAFVEEAATNAADTTSTSSSRSSSSSTRSRTEDDLSDLLALYNEVLELTDPMIHHSSSSSSAAAASSQRHSTVESGSSTSTTTTSNNKRRWGKRIFSKKESK